MLLFIQNRNGGAGGLVFYCSDSQENFTASCAFWDFTLNGEFLHAAWNQCRTEIAASVLQFAVSHV